MVKKRIRRSTAQARAIRIQESVEPILGLADDLLTGSNLANGFALGMRLTAQGGTLPNPVPSGGEFTWYQRLTPTTVHTELSTAGPAITLRRAT